MKIHVMGKTVVAALIAGLTFFLCPGEEAAGILLQVLRTQGVVRREPHGIRMHSPPERPAQRPSCALRRKREGEIHVQVLRKAVHEHRLPHRLKMHPPPRRPSQRQPCARVVRLCKMKNETQSVEFNQSWHDVYHESTALAEGRDPWEVLKS